MKIIDHFDVNRLRRSIDTGTEQQRQAVVDIIRQVKQEGDEALFRLTERFDGARLDQLEVTRQEFEEAYREVEKDVIASLEAAIANIRRFHEQQRRSSWMLTQEDGTVLGQLIRPLERVGAYVPGGTAAYPSSVLMTVIPAQVAGVKEIVITTPPSSEGKVSSGVLVAADLLGIEKVYKVGGAQAIAALAYGTESIAPVDKIVGPGNIYVALAKREVFGITGIDMLAGPSDILVLADEEQNPAYGAADLLSQAEHDPLACAICVTPSRRLAQAVQDEVNRQLETLPRAEIARAAVEGQGAIYVTKDLDEAVDVVNALAPEHLQLMVKEPYALLGKIKHAGAIFLGTYSSEPVGDYFAGPNHVLPTNGTARFSSPLSVDDFVKKSSLIHYSEQAFRRDQDHVIRLAQYEGLDAHARAIDYRREGEEGK
ncbi:Histidinol dehydrogenase [Caldalkalibacillus thermarum TA2.A1]|uniref:Histidinol dehydrogenase n=1 Tax=Caldalkalibacillus thermarum (strain TA2.A1) TaxID=986075 RepID=F5L6U6_CALTT|nr:histidinol dehydrogenase [Caldalkalibacillus thermarum]EGL82932.1 Histidinol dehydrogenase [Caldalkalibacillus thermarum TA2.A1]